MISVKLKVERVRIIGFHHVIHNKTCSQVMSPIFCMSIFSLCHVLIQEKCICTYLRKRVSQVFLAPTGALEMLISVRPSVRS